MAASLSCAGPTAGRFLAREAEPDEAYVEGMEPAPPLGLLPVMDLLVGLAAEAVRFEGDAGRGVTIRGRFGRSWDVHYGPIPGAGAHLGRWRSSGWRCPEGPQR